MASVRTVVARRYLKCIAFVSLVVGTWLLITFLFASVPKSLTSPRDVFFPDIPPPPVRNFVSVPEGAKHDLDDYLNAKFGNSCYQARLRDDFTQRTLRNAKELERRGCEQQLPHALIIGMKQCGSDRIVRYLRFHPAVEVRTEVPIDYSDIYERGFEWYQQQMPYTTESQITLDKLPNYFVFPEDAPRRVRFGISPDTKLIAVVCDPVRRAVAEYARLSSKSQGLDEVQDHIKKTFEKSVFETKQENVAHLNMLIDNSIYFKHLLSWMRYFPPTQIYVVDGKNLKFSTFNEFRRLEEFLGLPNFYQESHFSFNNKLEAYCLSYPQNVCPREPENFAPRPKVDGDVKQRLYEFFEPFDRTLQEFFKQNLTWREQYLKQLDAEGKLVPGMPGLAEELTGKGTMLNQDQMGQGDGDEEEGGPLGGQMPMETGQTFDEEDESENSEDSSDLESSIQDEQLKEELRELEEEMMAAEKQNAAVPLLKMPSRKL